jgi:hypothetical protein
MKGLLRESCRGISQENAWMGEKIGVSTILERISISAINEKGEGSSSFGKFHKKKQKWLLLEITPASDRKAQFEGTACQNREFIQDRVLLPPKWKRVDKNYENLLLALLTKTVTHRPR